MENGEIILVDAALVLILLGAYLLQEDIIGWVDRIMNRNHIEEGLPSRAMKMTHRAEEVLPEPGRVINLDHMAEEVPFAKVMKEDHMSEENSSEMDDTEEDFPEIFDGTTLKWPGSTEHRPGLFCKEIIEGNGRQKAKWGDKVRFKYTLYDIRTGRPKKYSPDGLQFQLGDHKYGQGFDEGICGMRCEQTKRLAIRQDLRTPQGTKSWEVYDVTVVRIGK